MRLPTTFYPRFQKVRVLFRGAYSLILNHTLDNFFYVHEEYVDPKYILDNDNVTLQSVTDKHAVFCVSDPEFNVFETKMAPFVWIIQYFKAQRLIIVSHDVFNQWVLFKKIIIKEYSVSKNFENLNKLWLHLGIEYRF